MKLEQRTITTIVAEEGKLLVRKRDGQVVGDRFTLGYDYYDAGVPLSEPRMAEPEDFEEIDKPEDYEEHPIINQVQRIKRVKELVTQTTKDMNNLGLSSKEALEVAEFYPQFGEDGFKEGSEVKAGDKFRYKQKLYAVAKDHTIKPHYYPSENTTALYKEVKDEVDE